MILQEIPSKFVTVLRRQGNLPIVNQLYFESFGENLSNITDDVFETGEDRYNYRTHLRKLASQKTYEEIMEMFDNRLSFNARAFLSTLYKQR
jgi:vacuolar-type H+-ATPase subunit C/Vma6